MTLLLGRHRKADRNTDPALYRVSHWENNGFHIGEPVIWAAAEGQFAEALGHLGWFAPKVWTEGQWQARQATLAHAGRALTS